MDLIKAIWRRDVRALPSVVILMWAVGAPAALLAHSLWLFFIAAPLCFSLIALSVQVWRVRDELDFLNPKDE